VRILIISASYPPVLGGLQTVAHRLAGGLLGRGHTVQVVTSRHPRALLSRELIDGVPVARWMFLTPGLRQLRQRRLDLFLLAQYALPTTLLRLDRLIGRLRPDVINLHYPDAQIPFVLRLRHRFAARLVLSLHGHEVERWSAGAASDTACPERRQFQAALAAADMVTACSQDLLNQAVAIEPGVAAKGHVIHNGIDLRRFDDRTPYAHPRPYILALGRLNPQKGFDLLLDAFAQVAAKHLDIDLILAGEGEELPALQAQAARLGLGERVCFYGRAQPEQVVRLLNGCLFTAVSSRSEPFGIVALEALGAGKPVLATRVGGLPEFLDRGGLAGPPAQLVEPTVAGIAHGLAAWLDPAARAHLARPGAPAEMRAYSWERAIDRYEQVLGGRQC
jgi:glycosyltransferase involved in cell wall biosynthesis